MRKFLTFLVIGTLALFPVLAFGQGAATIAGKVTDEDGNPLPGANVIISSLDLGAATDVNGNYTFSVPAKYVQGQQVKITARFIGFQHKDETITLNPGTIALDIALEIDVLNMDAVIVTGLVDETPKTKLAFSVGRIDEQQLEHAPATSPESSLRGKVAGVRVVQGSGAPGSSGSVLLRAPTSINSSGRSLDPLYIIDGVIIDPSVTNSPLADIPTEDIESIEVVKGAAGASLYGSRAANGVIVINTSRGDNLAINETRIRVRNEFGKNALGKKLGLNMHHNSLLDASGNFVDVDGNSLDPRARDARAEDRHIYSDGTKAPTNISFFDNEYKYVSTGWDVHNKTLPLDANGNVIPPTLLSDAGGPFNQIDRFFDPGLFMNNTVSISRNMRTTNFLVSFAHMQETGVVDGLDGYNRKNLRMNIDHNFRESLSLGVSAMFTQTDRKRTASPNPFFALTFMAPDVDLSLQRDDGSLYVAPDPTSVEDNPLFSINNADRPRTTKRIIGSFNLRYTPLNWFNIEGGLSYDRSDRRNESFYPIGYESLENIGIGSYYIGNFLDQALNGNVTASLNRDFGDLNLKMKARGLFERAEYKDSEASGSDLGVQGTRSLALAADDKLSIDSYLREIRSDGYSLITALDYKDRYIADFLIRRDGSSLFGPDERWATYYRISGAYRLSQEDWWFMPNVDEFKLRASYGTAGGRPSFTARFETWSVSGGVVSKGTLGNKKLKPEFTKELEVGMDIGFFNRLSLELTYATSTTEDQLLNVPLPGYAGYSQQWLNAGTLESSTFELSLNASLKRSRDISWTMGVNFDKSTQEITELNVPPYSTGIYRIEAGEDLGAIYGDLWISSLSQLPAGVDQSLFNVNDDGLVVYVGTGNTWQDGIAKDLWGTGGESTDEFGNVLSYSWGIPIKYGTPQFQVGPDGEVLTDASGNPLFSKYNQYHRLGDVIPDFNLGVHSTFQYKGISLYTLFDAQVGGEIYNNTNQWGLRELKLEEVDQAGKSDATKKPALYYATLYNVNADNSHFVEDGTYLKLRELSVRYTFNKNQLSGLMGGLFSKLTVGFIGRNLITITDYKGYDPEVGGGGSGQLAGSVLDRYDGFGYPNFKTFTGIIEFEF